MKDYYQILGIDEDADEREIKKAYRQKVLELHPDVNPSAEAVVLFQHVQEAYQVLGDENARLHYDSGTVIINFEDFEEPAPTQPYDAAPQPVPTNFADYAKQSTITCLIALVFGFSFLFDLNVMQDLNQVEVQFTEILDSSGPAEKWFLMYVETEQGNFEATTQGSAIYIGEKLQMKKSHLYGFIRFKRAGESAYQLTNESPIVMFVIAALVLFSGIFGLLPLSFVTPERKFNAAIVGGFFSLALLIFLLAV